MRKWAGVQKSTALCGATRCGPRGPMRLEQTDARMCASSRRLPTLPSGARRWEKAHRWSLDAGVEQSAAAKSYLARRVAAVGVVPGLIDGCRAKKPRTKNPYELCTLSPPTSSAACEPGEATTCTLSVAHGLGSTRRWPPPSGACSHVVDFVPVREEARPRVETAGDRHARPRFRGRLFRRQGLRASTGKAPCWQCRPRGSGVHGLR